MQFTVTDVLNSNINSKLITRHHSEWKILHDAPETNSRHSKERLIDEQLATVTESKMGFKIWMLARDKGTAAILQQIKDRYKWFYMQHHSMRVEWKLTTGTSLKNRRKIGSYCFKV